MKDFIYDPIFVAILAFVISWFTQAYNASKKVKKRDDIFKFTIFLKRNWLLITTSFLTVIALFILVPWIEKLLMIPVKHNMIDVELVDDIHIVLYFVVGFFNIALFKALIDLLKTIVFGAIDMVKKLFKKRVKKITDKG
jgi:hypothetical protein